MKSYEQLQEQWELIDSHEVPRLTVVMGFVKSLLEQIKLRDERISEMELQSSLQAEDARWLAMQQALGKDF